MRGTVIKQNGAIYLQVILSKRMDDIPLKIHGGEIKNISKVYQSFH